MLKKGSGGEEECKKQERETLGVGGMGRGAEIPLA